MTYNVGRQGCDLRVDQIHNGSGFTAKPPAGASCKAVFVLSVMGMAFGGPAARKAFFQKLFQSLPFLRGKTLQQSAAVLCVVQHMAALAQKAHQLILGLFRASPFGFLLAEVPPPLGAAQVLCRAMSVAAGATTPGSIMAAIRIAKSFFMVGSPYQITF